MIPLPDQKAETIASAFVRRWILRFGVPVKVLTDQGANYMSDFFKKVCELMKISRLRSSPYHPESNGKVERVHRTIAGILSHYVNDKNSDWDTWVPYAVLCYNTKIHRSTGFSPHEIVFGHVMRSPFEYFEPTLGQFDNKYLQGLKEKLETLRSRCKINDARARRERAAVFNRGTKDVAYECGQYVYLSDPCTKTGGAKKFHYPWKGPYLVTEVIPPCNVRIQLPYRSLLVHKNRLKLHLGNLPTLGFPPCGERRRGRPRKHPPTKSAEIVRGPASPIGDTPFSHIPPRPGVMSPRSHILAESEDEERWEEMSQVSTSSSEGGERQESAIQEPGSPIAERERAEEASTPESTEEQRYPSTTESQAAARQRSPYLLRPRPTPTPPEPLGVREGTPRRTPASCLPSESSTLREYAHSSEGREEDDSALASPISTPRTPAHTAEGRGDSRSSDADDNILISPTHPARSPYLLRSQTGPSSEGKTIQWVKQTRPIIN
ncbi:uncharacterized protein LOC124163401 [Ischnura elegans]|uniref:uncharacterized protein LOC124163388 n=1 Tax=Ischnura elegans TaxID=197161 RepID=UPI001ED871E4|nr:uncharacterized protein LOC124163388 [Ischnura elegans]XP_046396244.1 uncharacterized protein LOC124163401 [Ischnura elegans]